MVDEIIEEAARAAVKEPTADFERADRRRLKDTWLNAQDTKSLPSIELLKFSNIGIWQYKARIEKNPSCRR
jgi:hypothetical protein